MAMAVTVTGYECMRDEDMSVALAALGLVAGLILFVLISLQYYLHCHLGHDLYVALTPCYGPLYRRQSSDLPQISLLSSKTLAFSLPPV